MREPPPTSWHTEKTTTNEPGYWVLAHQAPPPKLTGQRQRKGKTPPLSDPLKGSSTGTIRHTLNYIQAIYTATRSQGLWCTQKKINSRTGIN